MVTKETSAPKEEGGGTDEKEGQEAGVASIEVDSIRGRLAASCASLLRINSILMEPMA